MERVCVYNIPCIPDCTHYHLLTACGGDARDSIFRAAEHLLRMVASFEEGQLVLAVRYLFQPTQGTGLQDRLRLELAVKVGHGLSDQTVHQLIDAGPLAEFYTFRSTGEPRTEYALGHDFSAIAEVVRQEEALEPLIAREDNDHIPSLYYALYPFECQADNDYLTIDRLLSKMDEPCAMEILVRPVKHHVELAAHYGYITHLMSINQYGDDLIGDRFAPKPWSDNQLDSQVLTRPRKKDPIADEIVREHQELHRSLRQPQLLFHVKAFAARPEQATMLAAAVAEAGLTSGRYRILSYQADGQEQDQARVSRSLADSCDMRVSMEAMYSDVWDRDLPRNWQGMSRLCRMATVDELKGLVRLPVGAYGSPRCIRRTTDPKIVPSRGTILIGDDLESQAPAPRAATNNLSELFECEPPANLELRLAPLTLTKHMFVAGVPGSGKTTAVFNTLVQLFRLGVPFLVIEPAKTEYRILKTLREHHDPSVRALAEQMRVYTPGNDALSPFRFNPLEHAPEISRDEHISQLLACFEAAMPLGGPLQALIAEAVETVYDDRAVGDLPQMNDLVDATRRIMEAKQYEGDIRSNLQAAIEVRLGLLTRRAMGRIFRCYRSIPDVADLLEYPTIIELDYLSQEHACLVTLFLLAALRERIRVDPRRQAGGLHHVTVIEEAHNIVGRHGDARASEDSADPKAFAAQYVARMLAELRALGEGIIIADQLPSAVAPEVVKNTGTKLAHRLVSNDDRENLGGAMLMGAVEIEEIARLSPGEAYFYSEGLHKPRRLRCLNANAYLGLGRLPTGAAILPHLSGDAWFVQGEERRHLAALDLIAAQFPRLLDAIQHAVAQLKALVPERINLAGAIEDPIRRREELDALYATLVDARDELHRAIEVDFQKKTWEPQVGEIESGRGQFESVRLRSDEIMQSYNDQVVVRCDEVMRRFSDTLAATRALRG